MVLSGVGRIYLFWVAFFEGEGLRFWGYDQYIIERKLVESYTKKEKMQLWNQLWFVEK